MGVSSRKETPYGAGAESDHEGAAEVKRLEADCQKSVFTEKRLTANFSKQEKHFYNIQGEHFV